MCIEGTDYFPYRTVIHDDVAIDEEEILSAALFDRAIDESFETDILLVWKESHFRKFLTNHHLRRLFCRAIDREYLIVDARHMFAERLKTKPEEFRSPIAVHRNGKFRRRHRGRFKRYGILRKNS